MSRWTWVGVAVPAVGIPKASPGVEQTLESERRGLPENTDPKVELVVPFRKAAT